MKRNHSLRNCFRIMKKQEIPREERREFSKYITGFCNAINGYTYTVNDAINSIHSSDLRGVEAIKYIKNQIKNYDNNLSQSLIRGNLISYNPQTF